MVLCGVVCVVWCGVVWLGVVGCGGMGGREGVWQVHSVASRRCFAPVRLMRVKMQLHHKVFGARSCPIGHFFFDFFLLVENPWSHSSVDQKIKTSLSAGYGFIFFYHVTSEFEQSLFFSKNSSCN